ncbi:MAG: hypothetical protein A3K19_21460 [Lentisphaerae bacterium RIFOXYB12_FULL_65_16]|nr:MAG: hypothetical protein A3K18_34135 [Lentisphaerae bacterium RIFOXYA12_64_32]OGV93699.1 MAG: hypothetical protein A3K19_21460 [Lentisphaerae bacterium RIFOXYB12_FULL_65_16]
MYFGACALGSLAVFAVTVLATRRPHGTADPKRASRDTTAAALDFENPYASLELASNDDVSAWREFRWSCRLMGMLLHISLGCVVCFLSLAILLPVWPWEHDPFGFSLLFGILVGLACQAVWEAPTRIRALSFARQAVARRGVDPADLDDRYAIGVSEVCTGEGIGSGSDMIGFLRLTPEACVLHTNVSDILIPRCRISSVDRARLRGDTMAWVGVKVIAVTWHDEPGGGMQTLYLLSHAAETSFGIKARTNRLYAEIDAWW